MYKKILTILILLSNVLIRRKHYKLKFVAEIDGPIKRWYFYFPKWGFSHSNLEMVSGADQLCEYYANDSGNTAFVDIIASRKDLGDVNGYHHYIGETFDRDCTLDEVLLYGRTYVCHDEKDIISNKCKYFWICPVTLFVLGRYPKHLYICKKEK